MNDSENNEPSKKGMFSFLEDKQSQIATILIGVLLVIAGGLTYNYFKTISQPQNQQEKISFGEMITPTQGLKAPQASKEKGVVAGAYTVKPGDSLWRIAQNEMGNGFAWKELAQANNIPTDNPTLMAGQVLNIPKGGSIASGTSTVNTVETPKLGVSTSKENLQRAAEKLPATYTVVRGDNLWQIAQKYYGDGHKWHSIFDYAPNRLSMISVDGRTFPLIHSGNVLTIPTLPTT